MVLTAAKRTWLHVKFCHTTRPSQAETRQFETRLIKIIHFKIHFTWYEPEVDRPAVDTEHYC